MQASSAFIDAVAFNSNWHFNLFVRFLSDLVPNHLIYIKLYVLRLTPKATTWH